MFCTWAGSFALCYMVSLRFFSRDTVLLAYWRGTFPPHTPSQIVSWVIYSFFTALENPAPLNALLGASLFVAGLGQLLRERKRSLGFLIAPLIVLFLASLLNHYPLYGRLLLFACPILLLVVSEGAVWVYNTSRRLSPILGIVFLALLLAKPMYRAAAGLIQPTRPDDIKGAFNTFKRVDGLPMSGTCITAQSTNRAPARIGTGPTGGRSMQQRKRRSPSS
jgi:hypothetical protein